MISTAIALQDATKQAVMDDVTMTMASGLFALRNEMNDEEFSQALFQYSAMLASLTTTLAIHAIMTESQVDELLSTIKEIENMGKDIN